VRDLCAELATHGVPETIQHDDLNDGQVFERDGRYAVLDWGDACVAHPFFSLSVALEGEIAWGVDDVEGSQDTRAFRDAYLSVFADSGSPTALDRACDVALRLGWVCRAINGHGPGPDAARMTRTRLRMFLDGRP
jgi:hypothetical protein